MRKNSLLLPLMIYLALLLAGCSGQRVNQQNDAQQNANQSWLKQTLYAQYNQWKGVKYKAGGLSKAGVDCSGFVYLTYEERLGIKLPRSTDEQVSVGAEIQQNDLLAGDLVFFRTGRNVRHVGIYLEDGKFVHASTEKGVMLSNLADPYWTRTYWKSVRVKGNNSLFSLAH